MVRFYYWAAAALVLAAACVYYWFNPAAEHFFPPCIFRKSTGLYCAGCGSQRALHQLLHGNFVAAFRYNALFVLAIPYLSLGFIFDIRNHLRGFGERPAAYRKQAYVLGIFIGISLFMILRNIPFAPFNWLAPTSI